MSEMGIIYTNLRYELHSNGKFCHPDVDFAPFTLAGTGVPQRFFLEYPFCLPVECHHFSIAYQPSFLRPPEKFQDPDPLTFDL